MNYRAAYQIRPSGEKVVHCIGYDKGQIGNYADGIIWCTFTFSELPTISEAIKSIGENETNLLCFKVVDDTVVLREVDDILVD